MFLNLASKLGHQNGDQVESHRDKHRFSRVCQFKNSAGLLYWVLLILMIILIEFFFFLFQQEKSPAYSRERSHERLEHVESREKQYP